MEIAGRNCYKSESKISGDSAESFVRTLIKSGHEAMIEFGDITVRIITNRGVLQELARHRLVSLAVESSRYCNYKNKDMEFIRPVWKMNTEEKQYFMKTCQQAEMHYKMMMTRYNWSPQQAREVLPNSLKTEIVLKCNIREFRLILKLRCSKQAHPQFRALALSMLKEFYRRCPVIFEDLYAEFFPEDIAS